MQTLRRALFLLCLLALAPLAGARAAAQDIDLQSDIRAAVRWLRSTQDPLTGAYGGGVEGTALALRAFSECPDRYRPADGPFVRKALDYLLERQRDDGHVCDGGADAATCAAQTTLAARAFLAVGGERASAALAKALRVVGEPPAEDAVPEERLLPRARELLGARDGAHWDGPRGKVAETASAIVELSRLHARSAPKGGGRGAAVALPSFTPAQRDEVLASMERGALFLAKVSDGGKWGAPGDPNAGITAMCLAALQTVPAPRPEPVQEAIDAGLDWLVTLQNDDGSIHDGQLPNYVTSASILALARSGRSEYAGRIARAAAFLQDLQLDEGEGYSEGDVYYGGIGYGSTERPDLSNLQMALEALAESGVESDAAVYTKAMKFLERCQNRSESNDVRLVDGQLVVTSGDDGGAGYRPGDSKAGFVELPDGTRMPRSYGSMTYALLKCFVFAGLDRDDPRLEAAWEWCRDNYTLDVNPGFGASSDPTAAYQGLFYYFHTMARALDAFGAERITDAAGREHDWRAELSGRLVAMQSKLDGSWINANSPRWYEGNPLLATAYALLTLDAALPGAGQ